MTQLDTRPPTTGRVNVAADLAERAERLGWAKRPAFHTDRRMWTHGEVHDLAARAATVLVERGVRPGDHGHLPVYYNRIGRQVLEVGATDVTFSISKLFFAYGFGNALVFPLYSGSSAVLLDRRPIADRVSELVDRHGVTMLYGVPSAYAALVERGDADAYATLRGAVSAGETLPMSLGQRAADLLGAPIYEQLGSTEAGHAFCANAVRDNVPGTIGRPVPGFELELRDASGTAVEGEGDGELWVRGPTVMREYLNRPEETERALVAGWLSTRDLVHRRADGTYAHLARVDDMEMVGGITVAPAEVERLLGEHPLVREVAVAAVTDRMGATKLRAFFVPAGPLPDRTAVEAELMEFVRQRLAAYKVPRTVRAVPTLPRTSTGKLRRHVVRTGVW